MVGRMVGRAVALAVPGGVLVAAWVAYQCLNAAAVRAQVVAHLRERFVGADVSLGSAQFRLLGGITFDNLTLFRRDDPSQTPFLHVPSGIILHDKEQLARGKLAIRKLKFERPRLTVSRMPDGRWNVDGILGPVHPDVAIPVVAIEQGVVVVEFGGDGRTPPVRVELHRVQGTLLNDPLPLLQFDFHADAGPYGPLALHGGWHRTQEQLSAAVDVAAIPLDAALLREVTRYAPAALEPVERLAGIGRLHLDLTYRAAASQRWHHRARVEIRDGRFAHRDLPFPVEQLDLEARWDDGRITLERVTAQAGASKVAGRIEFQDTGATALAAAMTATHVETVRRPDDAAPSLRLKDILQVSFAPATGKLPPASMSAMLAVVKKLEFTVGQLPVGPELFAKLPPQFQRINARFAPLGPLDVTWLLDRDGSAWTARVAVRAAGVRGRFDDFPYPLSNVRGRVDWSSAHDKAERLELDLTAETPHGKPATIRGGVEGDGPDPGFTYDITGDDLIIDEALMQALPAKFQTVARSFHPRGQCDTTVLLRHVRGEGPARQQYHIRFHDAALRYDAFPYPLDDVTGTLDIRLGPGTPDDAKAGCAFAFENFRGQRHGGDVTFRGVARPSVRGTQIDLDIHGERVPLDGEMAAAFARMKLSKVWELFAPSGRMNFTASVRHVDKPDGPPEFDIRVAPVGATLRPTFFPLVLSGLSGSFRLTRGHAELGEFRAIHGATEFRIAGGEVWMPEGGYRADVRGLQFTPLPVDADFVRALPPAIQAVCRALQPKGTLAVQVRQLVVDAPPPIPGPPSPPLIYWDGNVAFAGATLKAGIEFTDLTGTVACRGNYRGQLVEGVEGHVALDRATVLNQPLENLHARLLVDGALPQVLQLRDISAALYGGRLGGEARVEFGAGLKYAVDLKALELDLVPFADRNRLGQNSQVSGKARAELYLSGTGAGVGELEGGGTVHVPNGRLYNLPFVLDVLKLPNLHAPDGTAFEEAHAEFKIHGRRIEVQRIDLIGSAFSLGGRGELNLDGSEVELDLYAVWGHIVQVLPPGLREVPPWLSKNLLKIHARGRLGGQLDFATEPVPGITQPVKRLLDAARGRSPAAAGR